MVHRGLRFDLQGVPIFGFGLDQHLLNLNLFLPILSFQLLLQPGCFGYLDLLTALLMSPQFSVFLPLLFNSFEFIRKDHVVLVVFSLFTHLGKPVLEGLIDVNIINSKGPLNLVNGEFNNSLFVSE